MIKRFIIVFILGFSSGLPLALASSTLQAWFADAGMSVLATGCLSLLGLPYLYRFIWAPILDRYSLIPYFGKRRSWILVTQVLLCIGFNLMAWFTPETSYREMAILGFILAGLSATQDATIDAHRTEYLPVEEYGLGASIASLGYRLALLVAGGAALIIAQHAGWAMAYRIMGGLMCFGVIAIIWSPEPSSPVLSQASLAISFMEPIRNLALRPGVVPFCFFLLFYKLGEAFTTSTSGIVMPFLIQGMGFSLETIAYVNKIIGVIAIVVGGLIAGFVLLRGSLYKALLVFGLLQAITNSLFAYLAISGPNLVILASAVVSDNMAAGMGSTALVALFMRFVDHRFTATQFSILVALSSVPRVFSGPFGAFLEVNFGWAGLYQIAFLLSFGFIPFLMAMKKQSYMTGTTMY